jgi:hypothetical protein
MIGTGNGGLFLMGCGPGRLECRRSDSDAALMADDRVLAPFIADETGATGAAKQRCQRHAREFGHSWFHIAFQQGMRSELSRNAPHASANQVGTQDSRGNRSRRHPSVTVQERGTRYLADREGAGCQRAGFRFSWLPPSAVQTRIDGDGKTGIQIHGPLQHERPFAFIASFHARTVTRVYQPDHWSEVLFGWAKGLLRPKTHGPFGPFRLDGTGVS